MLLLRGINGTVGNTNMLGGERSATNAGKTQSLQLRCVYINDVE